MFYSMKILKKNIYFDNLEINGNNNFFYFEVNENMSNDKNQFNLEINNAAPFQYDLVIDQISNITDIPVRTIEVETGRNILIIDTKTGLVRSVYGPNVVTLLETEEIIEN